MDKIRNVTLEGKIYNAGFRVVTTEMKSLGLRRNPNILKYPINEWYYLSEKQIISGPEDFGGIWVTRNLHDAKKLVKYMDEKYNVSTRLFEVAFDKILYSNSYRIKTNGIYLFNEITL